MLDLLGLVNPLVLIDPLWFRQKSSAEPPSGFTTNWALMVGEARTPNLNIILQRKRSDIHDDDDDDDDLILEMCGELMLWTVLRGRIMGEKTIIISLPGSQNKK